MHRKENNAGLYITIAVHLLVLIVLLATRISSFVLEETTISLDFAREEEVQKEQQQKQLKEEVSKELDAILSGSSSVSRNRGSEIRNLAVDASEGGRVGSRRGRSDIVGEQLSAEARRVQERLDASRKDGEAYYKGGSDDVYQPSSKNENKGETYKGPSVISYSLDGRKAMSLPIPVYKCIGGGDVSVAIMVNKKGYVVSASVIANASSSDACLQEYAIKAAKSSRFTASVNSPERQAGEIVYRFIAQ